MDDAPIPSRTTSGAPETELTAKVLRGLGFALLAGAIAVDTLGPVIVRWRRYVATRAIHWADELAPTENFLLDTAVEFLRASDRHR